MIIESIIERNVATIDEGSTVLDAARLMTSKYIGSVIVSGRMGVTGLFTERDLMMLVVGEGKDPAKVLLSDVVVENFVKVTPQDSGSTCLDLMKEHRCRHLLVFDGEDFIGIVSLRDMVALLMEEKEHLIVSLNEYISA
ncbi:MAG: CBS domain-containing protein [Mariprofundaceae bacterium]